MIFDLFMSHLIAFFWGVFAGVVAIVIVELRGDKPEA